MLLKIKGASSQLKKLLITAVGAPCNNFSKALRNFPSRLLIAPNLIRFCCRGGAVAEIHAKPSRNCCMTMSDASENYYPYS